MHTRFPSLAKPTTELSLETVPSSPPSLKPGPPWLLLPQYPVLPPAPTLLSCFPLPPHSDYPSLCPMVSSNSFPQPTPFPQHPNMSKPLLVLSSSSFHPGSPLPFSDRHLERLIYTLHLLSLHGPIIWLLPTCSPSASCLRHSRCSSDRLVCSIAANSSLLWGPTLPISSCSPVSTPSLPRWLLAATPPLHHLSSLTTCSTCPPQRIYPLPQCRLLTGQRHSPIRFFTPDLWLELQILIYIQLPMGHSTWVNHKHLKLSVSKPLTLS